MAGLLLRLCALLVLMGASASGLAQTRAEDCPSDPPPYRLPESRGVDPPMQYCFARVQGRRVLWLYGGVGADSASQVQRGLRQERAYDEVWVNSPGGSVAEALEIGQTLRRLRAHVRVPAKRGVVCISACTILMLGGYNRTVDQQAIFIVHAKSGVMRISANTGFGTVGGKLMTWGEAVEILKQEPEQLKQLAQYKWNTEVNASTELISYYQTMIEGLPQAAAYRQLAARALPALYDGASPARRFSEDLADIQARGLVALQEIFTQVELGAMSAIYDGLWRERASLGVGAEEALKIFRAGLNCRIQDLCPLEPHQLEQLGYHNFTPQ
ncbi:ATP-dependent Clp protease proteolytic subunit [Pelomonas sp. V22]|uniref:ATP-dependent Clp protease proteolytic subunit n=1 Tax=Pelomonas sp. V22 TaxID=2822139 RepID=UPI0024A8A7DC|nr:ATP-dependent Clp protease proteolytic subunit [Pelomonas sp. V22]MDI4634126.1 ATP-dependent Clp protease proteolytic subunit [Pelomonas sp. V22]